VKTITVELQIFAANITKRWKMTAKKTESLWSKLSKIDCTEHVEKKGNFNYLSWAWAWTTLKEHCPDATFEKHWFEMGDPSYSLPYAMDKQGNAYVKVTVTVDGQSISETYPVTNDYNKSIQKPDSMEVNTALQRCLVKAIAFHGLAARLYAGEDFPPNEDKPVATIEDEKPAPFDPSSSALLAGLSVDEEERAAIIQFDGEKPKKEAEKRAKQKSVAEWREAFLGHPEKPVTEKDGKTVIALPSEGGDFDTVLDAIETFMPRVNDKDLGTDKEKVVSAINDFWRTNVASFEKIMADSPETHATILGMFKEAKATANRGNIWRQTIEI
jgi:hypothetical protein